MSYLDELNESQRVAVEHIFGPIMVIAGAGSGKTSLIKLIIQSTKNAVLTATTGIAAMNIGGQTLHSLFRLGAKLMLKAELSKHKCPNQALFDALEILVIDEISMLRADLLDAIDQLLRTWRQKWRWKNKNQSLLTTHFS